MTHAHKVELWIAIITTPLLAVAVLALVRSQKQKPVMLRGAVIVADTDSRKQLPIGGVRVSADHMQGIDSKSDSAGFFTLTLPRPVRRGHPIVLHFRHPQYRPLDLNEYVGNQLYIVHLTPIETSHTSTNQPTIKVSNVRVTYTVKSMTELNVGSAVKTFDAPN